MMSGSVVRRVKLALLATAALGYGTMFGTSCGVGDLRDNLVAGTLNYVKTSTGEFWGALIPKWNTIIQQQQQGT